ncbi:MAG: acetate kinase [Actinomycetota bacterium]
MRALILNAGSSSLKFQVIDTESRQCLSKGLVERIGSVGVTYSSALNEMMEKLVADAIPLESIQVVGHRVVHGGKTFSESVLLDDKAVAEIEKIIPLAPLHNPANVAVIKELRKLVPHVPHVAVFDTAFHATLPEVAYTYALNAQVSEKYGIRRYGFHGTSHRYVATETARFLGKSLDETSLIICHIGNGASVAAVMNGQSIDTSMGFTPLEGLVMGTRTGDIDAGILFHLAREENFTISQLDSLVNKESGLLGLSGETDMREIRSRDLSGDKAAQLARAVYAYRIRKYIGAYMTLLPNLDAVVFTAGVGENDAELRDKVMSPLAHLGFSIDSAKNVAESKSARVISTENSRLKTLVVPTNEELEIALESANIVGG